MFCNIYCWSRCFAQLNRTLYMFEQLFLNATFLLVYHWCYYNIQWVVHQCNHSPSFSTQVEQYEFLKIHSLRMIPVNMISYFWFFNLLHESHCLSCETPCIPLININCLLVIVIWGALIPFILLFLHSVHSFSTDMWFSVPTAHPPFEFQFLRQRNSFIPCFTPYFNSS